MDLTTSQQTQQMINAAEVARNYNNNWSAQQAQKQMDYQTESNAKAMQFSATENQKNRDFQERMSNTSHQREVQDLIKAGLNPVLSANNGASTPAGNSASGVSSQGAKGDTDTGLTQLFSQMMGAIIGQATALQTTSMNNMTSLQSTKMMNDTAIRTSQIGAGAMLGTANINAQTNLLLQQQMQAFQEYMQREYPQTTAGSVNSLLNKFEDFMKQNGNGKSIGDNISTWLKERKEHGVWLNKNQDKKGSW